MKRLVERSGVWFEDSGANKKKEAELKMIRLRASRTDSVRNEYRDDKVREARLRAFADVRGLQM